MHKVFPGSALPLEWLCKIYLEWSSGAIENPSDAKGLELEVFAINQSPSLASYLSVLSSIGESSSLAKLAGGAWAYQNGDISEAHNIITRTFRESEKSATNFYATFILCKCLEELGYDRECEEYINTALILLEEKVKDLETRHKIKMQIDEMLIGCLYRQSKLTEAIDVIRNTGSIVPSSYPKMILWAKIYANSGDRLTVQQMLQSEDFEFNAVHKSLINSILLRAEGKYDLALKEIMEYSSDSNMENRDRFEMVLLQGQLLWESKQIIRSFADFLTAAKLCPHSWVPFLYLGHFYFKVEEKRDLEKAVKCYKKCLSLNPTNNEAGAMLSDIYRTQGKWKENLNFLTQVTQQIRPGKNSSNNWALLRLGMHYLACENFSLAIQNLQSALRSDSRNINAWECLADAYVARGSYNSALKAYDKILKLRNDYKQISTENVEDSLYAELQIATIKHKLGYFSDAILNLKEILQRAPNYVPAVKILGESMLAQAKDFLHQGLSRNALENCQNALTYLTSAVKTSTTDLSCLWTLMGETCLMIRPISITTIDSFGFKIPNELLPLEEKGITSDDGYQINVQKSSILSLASNCYIRSLQIEYNNAHCWHNLALTYYIQLLEHEKFSDNIVLEESDLKGKCLTSIKRAIQLEPNSFLHWNALGVFEMFGMNLDENPTAKSLAQHAFIKSIQSENNAIAWTNLGILYLVSNEYKSANKAFKEAQNQDPSYINCWVGQALLAELTGFDEEAMDLFRHTTILGNEPESEIGYAQWICNTLITMFEESKSCHVDTSSSDSENKLTLKKFNHGQYCIENMFGVTVATDCLSQYVDKVKEDPCALNMLGVLLEKEGLLNPAKSAFIAAIDIINRPQNYEQRTAKDNIKILDKTRQNLGGVLYKMNEFNEAEKQFTLATEKDFYGQIGLALSASRNSKHPQDVYNAYAKALDMAKGDHMKSQVLAAMATIAYKVQGGEASKTLLFQSCQLQPPCINALFSLLVLGIKQSDANLIGAAIGEIERFEKEQPPDLVIPCLGDIAWLKSLLLTLQAKHNEARIFLSKSIHTTPHVLGLWTAMALQLLGSGDVNTAAKCAQRSAKMTLMKNNVIQSSNPVSQQTFINPLLLVAFCLTSAGESKRKEALKAASKAVHAHPYLAESWMILLAVNSELQKGDGVSHEKKLTQMKIALSAKMILTSNRYKLSDTENYNELCTWIEHFL